MSQNPPPGVDDRVRCTWAGSDAPYVAYHDEEWGVPQHDDRHLFEMLVLEGAQAGLSWRTILNKRARYRVAFDGFDIDRVAAFDEVRVAALLEDPGIVRNRMKVRAAVANARAAQAIRAEHGSLDNYLWSFVGGAPRTNSWRALADIPVTSPEAEAMSRALKKRGMSFVGPTICYAFMQAVGMVNDHTVDCFRYRDLSGGD